MLPHNAYIRIAFHFYVKKRIVREYKTAHLCMLNQIPFQEKDSYHAAEIEENK
jgi:hypothetical protein